jgi:hypothetical protein
MATGIVILNPGAAVFPDGTASNLAPQVVRVKSSATAPAPYFLQLNFDAAQTEQVTWQFVMPANYASAPVLKVQYKMTSATSGDIKVDGRIGAITPGDATDGDAKSFGSANTTTQTVGATAGYVKEISLTMTNADSLAAGDLVFVYLARLGADAADTATGDCEIVSVVLSYTTT